VTGPARLVFVRHALPADGGVVLPLPDVGLGETGREQAALLAARLASTGLDALYASSMPRALETARPLADLAGLEPQVVPDLREIDFGELEGMPIEDIERTHPDLAGWTTAPSSVGFPGGETVETLSARAVEAARTIAGAHPGETAVVICHGVVIRALLADVLGMPIDSIFRFDIPYCSVSVVDWFGEHPLLRSLNAL
jgi:ribonuclease H / adenosylcobalamin/alpha-ribazole phosphatase